MMTHEFSSKPPQPEMVVIPKEKAVFWLDENGRWRNADGPFRHRRIIRHFHAAISRDENGYFVSQARDGIIEKVYFHHEDTALFAVRVTTENKRLLLILNTGNRLVLSPEKLFIRHDRLYVTDGNETIKFNERALFAIAEWIDVESGSLYIRINGKRYEIPESA